MKRAKLLCAAMLAVAIVTMGAVAAQADVITLQVSGSLSPDPLTSASCAPTGCTLGGEITINNVTGAVISADVTAAGFSPSVGPFTTPEAPHPTEGLTDLVIVTASPVTSAVALIFSTPKAGSLVGYTGGPLSTLTEVHSSMFGWTLTSGSLTLTETTVVPEPSTWAMVLIGFAGLGYEGYRRRGALARA